MTSGSVDKVGDIVVSGQASGRRILSHTGAWQDPLKGNTQGVTYTVDGVDYSGVDYVIDTTPGRSDNVLQPDSNQWTNNVTNNMFNMNSYESVGANSFFLNITWYPRYDPNDTYYNILLNIQNDPSDEFEKNITNKYCFSVARGQGEKKKYTWIPHLAKATGFMGGYLWHTIKHLVSFPLNDL